MGKKQKKNKQLISDTSNDNIRIIIITAVIILALFGIGYLIVDFVFTMNDTANTEVLDNSNELNYGKILAEDVFKQSTNDYVVFFVNDGQGEEAYNAYYQALGDGTVTKQVYFVEMSEQLNADYVYDNSKNEELYGDLVAPEVNKAPKNISELKIATYPTAIVFEDNQVSDFFEGDEIYDGLGIANQ